MTQESPDIPLCPTCNHHHVLGTRCSVCGHVGKSNIFPKMKMRSQERRQFHIDYFESNDDQGYIHIVREIRKMVFTQESSALSPQQELMVDANSRHFIAFQGDAPIACGRWRFGSTHSGMTYADIDRFAVLPCYRGKSFGRTCFLNVIGDIQSTCQRNGHHLVSIQIFIPPECSWIGEKLERVGYLGIPTNGGALYSRGLEDSY